MREKITLITLLLLFTVSLAQAATQHWLHVRVSEGGHDGEKVSVNLPVSLIDAVLGNLETDEFHGGMIQLDDCEFDREMIEAVYNAAVESDDGEFVKIEDGDESIHVVKKGDEIHINVEDYHDTIKVRIPLAVVKALLSNTDDEELNIAAALRELAESDDNTLVTVDGDDETIRVWVDDSMEGI
jgi:uncharacterized protein involved in tellurium resistance